MSMKLPACPYDVQSAATIVPAEFAPMVTSYICDGPQLSQPVWSQRIHCTRTGFPISGRDHRGLLGGLRALALAVRAGALEGDQAGPGSAGC